ncbi:MAG TPA: hypothetical protein DCX12_04525 [Chloroflexi bacterium]|nr:hypothetical protein [Chloroflexota bacterium]
MNQDEIDTARVVMRESLRTECQEVQVEAGDRLEVVTAPSENMSHPVLTLACEPGEADAVVEQIACGHFIVAACPEPISSYSAGREIRETVSSADPLRVLIHNQGEVRITVRVSLSVIERPGSYRIVSKEG